jgi:hypothetical protein
MGVVYKFTDELVEFILQQKKDNPAYSCRRIADIINEKFQLNVSKSSVNNVIKEAQLSSHVGRRSRQEPLRKKFEIPKEKKKSLFDHLDKSNLMPPASTATNTSIEHVSIDTIVQKPLEYITPVNAEFVELVDESLRFPDVNIPEYFLAES